MRVETVGDERREGNDERRPPHPSEALRQLKCEWHALSLRSGSLYEMHIGPPSVASDTLAARRTWRRISPQSRSSASPRRKCGSRAGLTMPEDLPNFILV